MNNLKTVTSILPSDDISHQKKQTLSELPTSEILKKKRGRKPKSYYLNKSANNEIKEPTNSEDEKIIYHLPMTISEINNEIMPENNIFIKDEDSSKNDNMDSKISINSSDINTIPNNFIVNNMNKITTHTININKNTKCWWCKNTFMTPIVQLPENYYNNIFYCIGHFCSYNCSKSYNLELNDSFIYKRESLINLLYFHTYSEYKYIPPAPHWLTLEDYGGPLTIEQFRENMTMNTKEYVILHPPLISRQMQIEESYKINKLKEVNIDKVNKIYSELDSEYLIKRNKILPNSHLNLESTMVIRNSKNKE